jgi:hypothetical protein
MCCCHDFKSFQLSQSTTIHERQNVCMPQEILAESISKISFVSCLPKVLGVYAGQSHWAEQCTLAQGVGAHAIFGLCLTTGDSGHSNIHRCDDDTCADTCADVPGRAAQMLCKVALLQCSLHPNTTF